MSALALQDLLLERGVVDASSLARAASQADREGRALAQVLVQEDLIEEDALAELAAAAVGTVVLDVDQGSFDEESLRLVPLEAARRHLLVPLAPDPDGESLRVVFADPLDGAAVDAARRMTGYGIQPLVGTVSGLLRAIDRAYRIGAVGEVASRSDIAPEPTRRVGPASQDGTVPHHRHDPTADVEQRIEALVLTLIDAGLISRADYIESLRRLLGR